MTEKVIIDVDPGIDDSIALIMAMQSRLFDILGITIVSGNVDVHQGAKNASYVTRLFQRKIPIVKGAAKPLKIDYNDATDTHGKDGLGEVIFSQVDDSVNDINAADFIIKKLNEYPGEVTVFALGPLTNLANVIAKDPDALKKAKAIRIMGGAAKVHGNCSPVAEYNFWCDPHSAHIFFKQQYEHVYLYPLDITYKILLSPNHREFLRQINNEISDFIYQITRFYVDFHWREEKTLGCVINDPLVVADVMDNIVDFYRADVDVVTEGIAIGESVVHHHEKGVVRVGYKVDYQKFFDIFFRTIFPEEYEMYKRLVRKEML